MRELGLLITGIVAGTLVCNCLKNNCPRPCPPINKRPPNNCPCRQKKKECPCRMVPFYDGY